MSPQVGTKKFAYTPKGEKAAAKEAMQTGMPMKGAMPMPAKAMPMMKPPVRKATVRKATVKKAPRRK